MGYMEMKHRIKLRMDELGLTQGDLAKADYQAKINATESYIFKPQYIPAGELATGYIEIPVKESFVMSIDAGASEPAVFEFSISKH